MAVVVKYRRELRLQGSGLYGGGDLLSTVKDTDSCSQNIGSYRSLGQTV